MNTFIKTTIVAGTFTLASCLSIEPPLITQQSDDVYEFSKEASFALNVARMSRKTAGLSDVSLPEDAQFKSNSALVGTEYAISFLTGGLTSLAGSLGAQSKADKAFNWKPMLIFTAELDNNNIDSSTVKVIENELSKTFKNIGSTFLGIARSSDSHRDDNFAIFDKGEACDKSELHKVNYEKVLAGGLFQDILPKYDQSCFTPVSIEVTGKVKLEGKIQDVIVVIFQGGYRRVTDITSATSGFALVPESYGRWGSGIRYKVGAPYAVSNNEIHFFVKVN